MLRKRNEYPRVITPKGVVAWASLDKPDFEYKDEGEFHVRLRFDPETPGLDELRAKAEELLDEAFEAKSAELTREKKGALLKKLHKVDVIKEELDRETGEPTGALIIRAGMKHRITPKNSEPFEKTPDVFDAKRKRLRKVPKVGPGSELKLSVRLMEYFISKEGEMGIRFELEGAQILKLVQSGSRDAASYGFDEEEGDSLADDGGFDEEVGGYTGSDDDGDADTDRDF